MILLFDIGNTNIVLGIVEDEKIQKTYRFITNSKFTEDDYYQKINVAIQSYSNSHIIDGAIISSVVPSLDTVFIKLLEKYYNIKPKIVGPGLKSCLSIKLDDPKELGADLLCDTVGAYITYGGPTIVVDMGTATKLVVVNEKKEFIGGAICAGIMSSLECLISSTSKLAKTSLVAPASYINKQTSGCIQSGIVLGHVKMIDGMIDEFIKELDSNDVKVILTGGYSYIVKDRLKNKVIEDQLVLLKGLLYIYSKNN